MLFLVRGAQADQCLADPNFLRQWGMLHAQCGWGTMFQSPGFAETWYRTYRDFWEPVLLGQRAEDGTLRALWPLALGGGPSDMGRRIAGAGAHQAEYHTFLADENAANPFATRAVAALQKEFPGMPLNLEYLPAGMPLEWVRHTHGLLHAHPRPWWDFDDGQEIEQSLKKSGNKSRLRQLKKIGSVHFKQIKDHQQLDELLQQISVLHDLRQVALSGGAPFQKDRLKLAFHHALETGATKSMLHVTALTAGEHLLSAQVNVVQPDAAIPQAQLWLIAHNPLFACHSPGKLHLLFLAQMLFRQGIQRLDLTPGGECYKQRFATHYDQVHSVEIYPSAMGRAAGEFRHWGQTITRRALQAIDLTPAEARASVARLKQARFRALPLLWRQVAHLVGWRPATMLFRLQTGGRAAPVPSPQVKRDCLAHLLAMRAKGGGPSRQAFMRQVHQRLELGQHCYTLMREGKLAALAWLAENTVTAGAESPRGWPADAPLVLSVQRFGVDEPAAQADARMLLRTVLHDAAALTGVKQVGVALSEDDMPARRALESLGLVFVARLSNRQSRRRPLLSTDPPAIAPNLPPKPARQSAA